MPTGFHFRIAIQKSGDIWSQSADPYINVLFFFNFSTFFYCKKEFNKFISLRVSLSITRFQLSGRNKTIFMIFVLFENRESFVALQKKPSPTSIPLPISAE